MRNSPIFKHYDVIIHNGGGIQNGDIPKYAYSRINSSRRRRDMILISRYMYMFSRMRNTKFCAIGVVLSSIIMTSSFKMAAK